MNNIIPEYQIIEERKSYSTTLLLCFMFGPLGLHRIYTGYVLIGLLQLMTGGGFGIWAIIDLISLWTNRYKDSNNNELEGYDIVIVWLTAIIPVAIILLLFFIK